MAQNLDNKQAVSETLVWMLQQASRRSQNINPTQLYMYGDLSSVSGVSARWRALYARHCMRASQQEVATLDPSQHQWPKDLSYRKGQVKFPQGAHDVIQSVSYHWWSVWRPAHTGLLLPEKQQIDDLHTAIMNSDVGHSEQDFKDPGVRYDSETQFVWSH